MDIKDKRRLVGYCEICGTKLVKPEDFLDMFDNEELEGLMYCPKCRCWFG